MKQHIRSQVDGLGLVGPLVEQHQPGQMAVLATVFDDLGAGPDRDVRGLEDPVDEVLRHAASSDGPRISMVTDLAVCDMYIAAWPAELAPPTM